MAPSVDGPNDKTEIFGMFLAPWNEVIFCTIRPSADPVPGFTEPPVRKFATTAGDLYTLEEVFKRVHPYRYARQYLHDGLS